MSAEVEAEKDPLMENSNNNNSEDNDNEKEEEERPLVVDDQEEDEEEDEDGLQEANGKNAGTGRAAAEKEDTILANDVKNIILQVFSPYFDDDGRGNDIPLMPSHSGAADGGAAVVASGGGDSSSEHNNNNNNDSNNNNNDNNNKQLEDTAPRYAHGQAKAWIALITEHLLEKLIALKKPFKYVVHVLVMRKSGAGLHVCSSCYYGQRDGYVGHSHDLSPHLYAVATVYWCAI